MRAKNGFSDLAKVGELRAALAAAERDGGPAAIAASFCQATEKREDPRHVSRDLVCIRLRLVLAVLGQRFFKHRGQLLRLGQLGRLFF